MITVKKVSTKKELKEYVLFSFELFKDNPNWIPPIIAEELETFDKRKNPAFHSAEAHFYVAYKEGKIAGKIAAIINWDEVNILKKSKVRFGWFDVIDDIEVTKALLEKVYELGRQHHLEMVEGPIGFSNLDKVGVLVKGFEEMGNMVTWYSMPYYKDHFEQLGLVKEKEYVESSFSFTNIDPAPFMKISKLIQERYHLRAINFTKTKDIMPYVDEMFDLFNETYAKLQSFVAINQIQKEYFKKKYISFINPEYIKFILDKDDKMVAFAIVMPGFSDALKKAKGKLFPFGFYHLLQARKHSKEAVFYLIGVTPEYQSKGITAIIFEEYYKIFKAKGIHTCVRTPELEENNAVHNLWKHFDSKITKRRRTYSKKL
ncbi:GNAT family N-acetyltransferase [Flavobacterium sp. NRK F7]|uniref:GNAT family N-acetyltransferase n=1 Tax=Flavobacterium sp. NRK F7 TaxID=2954930 RepID=UPI002090728B|nr:GNAT family N-acetyltransferase [Flavobacterium sp. NRK F7]MCO6163136.1 GNAT family N-acetyltransferase [Flavobacterium sp. NRK F7]